MHRNTPLDALLYYADCSAATAYWFGCRKRKPFNEFTRHILLTIKMVLDCYMFVELESSKEHLECVQDRLLDAVREHNKFGKNIIPADWNDLIQYIHKKHNPVYP